MYVSTCIHNNHVLRTVQWTLSDLHDSRLLTGISQGSHSVRVVAGAGVFGVEMFLLADGTLLLNEIAPRPHNSGHYTIEACATSQYEQHLRAILGWPLGDTSLVVGSRYKSLPPMLPAYRDKGF